MTSDSYRAIIGLIISGNNIIAIDVLQKEKKDGAITEDDLNSLKKVVQKITDSYIEKVDEML
ncbi:MAG: ribosome recycling factor, partial [Cyanobacteria bacterium J149]